MSGIYTGMSGMIASEVNLAITGNNIANSKTGAYKADKGVNSVFEEVYVNRVGKGGGSGIGQYDNQVVVDERFKVFKQGYAQPTNRALDIFINDRDESGVTFFEVQDGQNNFVTRDGRLYIDEEGNLTNALGYYVLSDVGSRINIGGNDSSKVQMNENGSLMNGETGELIANLSFLFINEADLQRVMKVGNNIYNSNGVGAQVVERPDLYIGYYESSNVDVGQEMVDLISSQKGYAMNSKSFQTYDKVMDIESNRLAK